MAYVNNETKSKILTALKPVFKEYGIKATVARNSYHSTLVVNLVSGNIDEQPDLRLGVQCHGQGAQRDLET